VSITITSQSAQSANRKIAGNARGQGQGTRTE
jgi:hypothetical protein